MFSIGRMTGMTADWNFGDMLSGIQSTAGSYVKVIIGIIGIVMFGVGVYQIAKNLISHGKAQTNWVITIALLLVGGALMLGTSWDVLKKIAKGGQTTIDNLGHGQGDDAEFKEPTVLINGRLIGLE